MEICKAALAARASGRHAIGEGFAEDFPLTCGVEERTSSSLTAFMRPRSRITQILATT
jgi:hypothetical protein